MQALDALDGVTTRPKHLHSTDTDNISISDTKKQRNEAHGTSADYALRRLRTSRPDLHARVLAGYHEVNQAP